MASQRRFNNPMHCHWLVAGSYDNEPAWPTYTTDSAGSLPREGGNVPCSLLEYISLEARQGGRQTANKTQAAKKQTLIATSHRHRTDPEHSEGQNAQHGPAAATASAARTQTRHENHDRYIRLQQRRTCI